MAPATATGPGAATSDSLLSKGLASYAKTPSLLKFLDVYLVFVMASGIAQFVYMLLAGTYPYNAFLSGFAACVGAFVLGANLRIQVNPENASESSISPERAFGDYVFSSLILYGFVINWIG